MKQKISIAAMMLLMVLTVTAADKKEKWSQATFAEQNYDFGTIKEEKGPVSHTFEFINTGSKPLIVVDAAASCGCTRPEFSAKPIKPGKKGKVKVTYSPIGRPGAFRKTIKVRTNGREKTTTLVITGTVVPKK